MGRRREVLVLVVAVVVASCGGDDGGGEAASTSAAVESTTTAPVTTVAPPAPADPPVVPVDERLEQRFDIPGGPDWVLEAAGSIWVKTDDGRVLRIDPETNQTVAEIEVASENCQGLGGDDGAIWTCDGTGGVVRIDPATNEVVAAVEVDKYPDTGHLPVVDGRVWVLSGSGDVLTGIADDAVDQQIDLGASCIEVAAVGDEVWATCLSDDTVLGIDLAVGEVTTRVTGLDSPRTLAASGTEVWVSYGEGLAHVDATTGEVVGVADASGGGFGGVAATADAVWSRTGFLRRVDPGTLEVVEEISAPEESGGEVIVAFGSLWTTAYDDAVLYRLTCGDAACT